MTNEKQNLLDALREIHSPPVWRSMDRNVMHAG